MRQVPTEHGELVRALESHQFPEERYWIDFKRQLYPSFTEGRTKHTDGQRRKAHLEFAQDVASMANRGGYLVYGVDENREELSFEPTEMPLYFGLRDTLVSVALDWLTPGLEIRPTTLSNPADSGRGFLVVEVPESPEAPHMVDHRYFGRSEAGRTLLDEPTVERLVLQRHRVGSQLVEEMVTTAGHDPGEPQREDRPRAYLTAVPTRGWPNMFADLTDMRGGGITLMNFGAQVQYRKSPQDDDGAFSRYMTFARRGHRIRGLWLRDWEVVQSSPGMAGRALGVGDDGVIRYLALRAAGATPSGDHAEAVRGALHETQLLRHLATVLEVVAELSELVEYRGAWHLGLECTGLLGSVSERHRTGTATSLVARMQILDDDSYVQTTRAETRVLAENATAVLAELLRPLLRNIDREDLLPD